MNRELKGSHVLIIALSAFAIIIAANLTMLFSATGTFPGLVVKNSYVASQGWNARTEAQQALAWQSAVSYRDGTLQITLADRAGTPVATDLVITLGRPTTDRDDVTHRVAVREGSASLSIALDQGTWRVDLATPDGKYRRSDRIHAGDSDAAR